MQHINSNKPTQYQPQRLFQHNIHHALYTLLLLAGSINFAHALPMPDSEVSYIGASATNAFVATEPYIVNIQGKSVTVPLWGASRAYDFSGDVPFVNPTTGKSNPAQIQAWDPVFANSFNPPLSGSYNLNDNQITNSGFPGRAEQRIINNIPVTMLRYNAGDNITEGKCRSQLNGYAVPPRTHVRWELEVAFGNTDGTNDWTLTPTGASPVLFWQMHSANQSNPPLAANVDTDVADPTKLMITFYQRVGTQTSAKEIARVQGLSRNTLIPIVIEAFLDERATVDGGKGALQISVNNTTILEQTGATLALGTNSHWWALDMYLWNEAFPYAYTRASFWKTARMLVFPVSLVTDTTAPSVPTNLVATTPAATQVNLSWTAATDNVGVTLYTIYREGIAIGTSTVPNFSDTSVIQGTTYNYNVTASDAAGNVSAPSANITVTTPLPTVTITSSSVSNITNSSATISWTTNMPSSGLVSYGTRANNLSSQVTFSASTTSHAVQLSRLNSNTTYYYTVRANTGSATVLSSLSSFKSASSSNSKGWRR